ncbi:MAG: PrsW family intramembrane metalloprotease [Bacteroidales bacterium]|nr:PrsW family intramembrane metalloprotease [Bacteroidales bacterium]
MKRFINFRKTGIINIIFQLLFLLVVFIFWRDVHLNPAQNLLYYLYAFGIVLFPCLIWMFFFYLQDRKEPEPFPYLLFAFVIGAAMSALIWLPLKNIVLNLSGWMYNDLTTFVLVSFLLYGGSLAIITFVLLKHVFQRMKEFDEPVDGMVYGAFIGTGYAFTESFDYLAQHDTFTLFPLVFTISANILIFSSSGSLTGYYIGKIKFTGKKIAIRSLQAVLFSMIAVGIYKTVIEIFLLEGFDNVYWYSFAATLLLSAVLLILALFRIRSLFEMDIKVTPAAFIRPSMLTLIFFILIIAAGLALQQTNTKNLIFEDEQNGFEFNYPFQINTGKNLKLFGTNSLIIKSEEKPIFLGTSGKTWFSVQILAHRDELLERSFISRISGNELAAISEETVTVTGNTINRTKYTYIPGGLENSDGHSEIYFGVADLIDLNNSLLLFEFIAPTDRFDEAKKIYDNMLKSLKQSQ